MGVHGCVGLSCNLVLFVFVVYTRVMIWQLMVCRSPLRVRLPSEMLFSLWLQYLHQTANILLCQYLPFFDFTAPISTDSFNCLEARHRSTVDRFHRSTISPIHLHFFLYFAHSLATISLVLFAHWILWQLLELSQLLSESMRKCSNDFLDYIDFVCMPQFERRQKVSFSL